MIEMTCRDCGVHFKCNADTLCSESIKRDKLCQCRKCAIKSSPSTVTEVICYGNEKKRKEVVHFT